MIEKIIKSLEINKIVIASTLSGLKEEEYNFTENENSWSIREIICHLHDEEAEDFRKRVEHILFTPEKKLEAVDPLAWPEQNDYKNQGFEWALKSFIIERDISVDDLEEWKDKNWDNTTEHPRLGKISARMMLHNWLAHDYIHIRQINRNRYLYLQSKSGDINLSYAGNW